MNSINKVVVYHKNAKRIEDTKLPAPYDILLQPWMINDVNIAGLDVVDVAKSL